MAIPSDNILTVSLGTTTEVGASPIIAYWLDCVERAGSRTLNSAIYDVTIVAGFKSNATSATYYNYSCTWNVDINGYSGTSKTINADWTGGTSVDPAYGMQVKDSHTTSITVSDLGIGGGEVTLTFTSNGNGSGTSGDDAQLTTYASLSSAEIPNTAPNTPGWMGPNSGIFDSFIDLSWGDGSDDDGDILHYNVIVSKNTWGSWTDIISESENYQTASYRYDISADPPGTRYFFGVYAIDSNGAWSSVTHPQDGTNMTVYKNSSPSAPTSLSPTSGVYSSSINVSWSGASDSDGQALVYDVEVSTNSGANWSRIISDTSSTSYNYDISSHGGGTKYRFRVRSKDTMSYYSSWKETTSDVIKNSSPSAPTSLSPTTGIYNDSINVSWSGASDPDGDALTYDVEVSTNSGANWSSIISDTSSTSYNYNISSHGEGTTYRFRVRAKDAIGYSGYYTSTSDVSKNRSPYAPSSVWTDQSFAQTSTTVRWNAASDPDGQTVSYKINIYKNNVLFTSVTSSDTSYNYTWPADTAVNTIFTFGVITVDSPYGYTSSETKGGLCVKKLPPSTPSFIVPVNNGTVYDKRPRLAITINNDPNGDNQKLYVTWKGVEYNSVDHMSWFSSIGSAFINGKTIIFKPQIDGNVATNTISIRTDNGYYSSSSTSININISNITATTITNGETIIKSNFITEMRTAINNVLQAYGKSVFTFTIDVSVGNKVSPVEIIEMRNKIQQLILELNEYDISTTTFDKNATWLDSVIFINSSYLDEIKTKLIDL